MRTLSWAEKAGICSVKLKRHIFGRCWGIQRYIYDWYETLLETKLTESTLTSLIYFSIPNRSGLLKLPESIGFRAI